MSAQVYADLRAEEKEFLRVIRTFNDVLLLHADDPLHQYQIRLRSLHRMGMLNLSLPHQDARYLSSLAAQKRSLVASLREAKKRDQRHETTMKNMRTTIDDLGSRDVEAENKVAEQQQLFRVGT